MPKIRGVSIWQLRQLLLIFLVILVPSSLASNALRSIYKCKLSVLKPSLEIIQYLDDLDQFKLLSIDEEKFLFSKKEPGLAAKEKLKKMEPSNPMRTTLIRAVSEWEAARTKLIESNLRLVVYIAKKYRGRGIHFDDLVAEGNLGLIEAIDRFDVSRGTKLVTYATIWIKEAIGEAIINKAAMVRVPNYIFQIIVKYYKIEQTITEQTGEQPTFEEITEVLQLKPSHVANLKYALQNRKRTDFETLTVRKGGYSQSDPLTIDNFLPVHEPNNDTDILFKEDLEQLNKGIAQLNNRQAQIVKLRFYEGKTLTDIGAQLGITRTSVLNNLNKAIKILQSLMEEMHPSAG